MFRSLVEFFGSPDDHDPGFVRMVKNILVTVMLANFGGLILAGGLFGLQERNTAVLITLITTLLLLLIAFIQVRRNILWTAKMIVPISLTLATTAIAAGTTGINSIASIAYPLIVVVAAVMLGEKAAYTVTPLVMLAVVGLTVGDLVGWTSGVYAAQTGFEDIFLAAMLIFATSGVLQLLIRRAEIHVRKARENEKAQQSAVRESEKLREDLEQRGTAGLAELEAANQRNQRRTRQFEAIAQVAHTAASIQSMDELLLQVTQLIGSQFEYYHVGIFLIDKNREYAVLRAANSEGGVRMLRRAHRLRVGQTGIVGFVSETGVPRIAMDVDVDLAFFDNPDLPDTRSEMALPLRVGGSLIGVLDVQSREQNAFSPDDTQVLTTLADQVAIAIQNVGSLTTAQQSLAESQKVASGYIQNAWNLLRSSENRIGYQFSAASMTPLSAPVNTPQILQTLEQGKAVTTVGEVSSLAVPIRLRGEVIGAMELRAPLGRAWNSDEIDIAEAVADRLSLAIETATVLESTQRRAAIEQVTSEMSSKISTSTRIESILRTAAEELSRAFGSSEVLVQIQPAIPETMSLEL